MHSVSRSISVATLILAFVIPVASQVSPDKGTERLTWPNKNWSLELSLGRFNISVEEIEVDGSAYVTIANLYERQKDKHRTLGLVIKMEPAKAVASALDLRDRVTRELRKNSKVNQGSIKSFQHNDILITRYSIDYLYDNTDLSGMALIGLGANTRAPGSFPNKIMEAYFVRDDVQIRVRLAAYPLKQDDENLFLSVIDSIHFPDNSKPSSAFDFYAVGKSIYLQKKYDQAIHPLKDALRLEQERPQLEQRQRRTLIWYLADAFGATRKITEMKEVLEYGVKTDPTFYRLHFGLARIHAISGDSNSAIAALEKAYSYQHAASQAGEHFGSYLPPPTVDPIFDTLASTKQGWDAIKAIENKYFPGSRIKRPKSKEPQ